MSHSISDRLLKKYYFHDPTINNILLIPNHHPRHIINF